MRQLMIFLWAAMPMMLMAQIQQLKVKVTNDWTERKTDEPVVIDLHQVIGLNWFVRKAVVTLDGKEVPCQLDDMDGDWRADELVFLTDIEPGTTLTFDVTLSAEGEPTAYEPRVYAHMGISSKPETSIAAFETLGSSNVFNSLYHHGVCFESELVGFRIYSDSRQNVDIYGKRTHRLELAITCFNSTAKHLASGYGHDVLWNGRSMACGTLRDWNDGVQEVTDVQRRGQRILAYGPLRTVVEVADFGWHGDLCCRTRYTLYAGHRDVKVETRFDTPLPDHQLFCTGVQKIGTEPQGRLLASGLAASWGRDWPDYGKKHLYAEQTVGLAVYVPSDYVLKTVEDSLNYVIVLHAPRQRSFHYWLACCADMEQRSLFHSAADWFGSLDRWRESLLHPVRVRAKCGKSQKSHD